MQIARRSREIGRVCLSNRANIMMWVAVQQPRLLLRLEGWLFLLRLTSGDCYRSVANTQRLVSYMKLSPTPPVRSPIANTLKILINFAACRLKLRYIHQYIRQKFFLQRNFSLAEAVFADGKLIAGIGSFRNGHSFVHPSPAVILSTSSCSLRS
jgi:hypothetical protein